MKPNTVRCINVTLIDRVGAPTTTQLSTSNPAMAIAYINDKVLANKDKRTDMWEKPIVAAYVYDTMLCVMTQYRVVYADGAAKIVVVRD